MRYSKDPRYCLSSGLFSILRFKMPYTEDVGGFFQVKFDQFVEQGKVLHNYASILELLLRLRQCCDHPFLVMRFGLYDLALCFSKDTQCWF